MTLRQAVLPLQEEGPGKLQPHPHELGPVEEDEAEGSDAEVQQQRPPLLRDIGPWEAWVAAKPERKRISVRRG